MTDKNGDRQKALQAVQHRCTTYCPLCDNQIRLEVKKLIGGKIYKTISEALKQPAHDVVSPPCRNIAFGSYDNTVLLPRPKHMYPTSRNDWITVDLCMLDEVLSLWRAGIWTLESCCGHCKVDGYIAVHEYSREKIESLGYAKSEKSPHVYIAKTHASIIKEA